MGKGVLGRRSVGPRRALFCAVLALTAVSGLAALATQAVRVQDLVVPEPASTFTLLVFALAAWRRKPRRGA